jgi:hypothetical protein
MGKARKTDFAHDAPRVVALFGHIVGVMFNGAYPIGVRSLLRSTMASVMTPISGDSFLMSKPNLRERSRPLGRLILASTDLSRCAVFSTAIRCSEAI